jgi:2-C-methyl-D-erythritol 4-phosphate cytidylyltransferase
MDSRMSANAMTAARHKSRFYALIACAGSGSRAASGQPKQYRPVLGRSLVLHTLDAFAAVPRIERILVVVAPGDRTLAPDATFLVAACGGLTRAATVFNGLQELKSGADASDSDWVLVHDAARCLVTPSLIERLIDACAGDEVGGLLAYQLPDTLKCEEGGRAVATLPRKKKWLAQTPQMFRIGLLVDALQRAGDEVTDEAGAVEALGLQPLLVPGGAQNFKITYPDDFALAEAVLRSRS